MYLSAKARASLAKVVKQFQAGDLSPVIRIARIKPAGTDDSPFNKWSLSNKIMAYIQTGDLDVRGFNQWKEVGRHVRGNEKAAFILRPIKKSVEDRETGEKRMVIVNFTGQAVFGISQTDGEDVPEVDYKPAELPPLIDVADRLGINVKYRPLPPDRLGACDIKGQNIDLGTTDVKTFFHELAHAAHARIDGKLKGGQVTEQETVAEFTATVLMHLYGLGDRTGNSWEYIKMYADDPLDAITGALKKVEGVLQFLGV